MLSVLIVIPLVAHHQHGQFVQLSHKGVFSSQSISIHPHLLRLVNQHKRKNKEGGGGEEKQFYKN